MTFSTVRARLFIGFSAVILLMVTLCVFAYTELYQIRSQAIALTADSVPGLTIIGKLDSASISAQAAFGVHAGDQSYSKLQIRAKEAQQDSAAITALVKEYESTVATPETERSTTRLRPQSHPIFQPETDCSGSAQRPFPRQSQEMLFFRTSNCPTKNFGPPFRLQWTSKETMRPIRPSNSGCRSESADGNSCRTLGCPGTRYRRGPDSIAFDQPAALPTCGRHAAHDRRRLFPEAGSAAWRRVRSAGQRL